MKRLALLLFFATTIAAQTRIASDFEIAQMKQQIAASRDFLSQLSGHLNLGDLYRTRSENATARSEYTKALEIAGTERLAARRASDMTRYATATAYAALADAKLGNVGDAFAAAEEAIRYTSGSAKSWNLYASAMTLLARPAKARSAAHNAVTIASRDLAREPSVANRLDLSIDQYSLAAALVETGDTAQAERLLRTVTTTLRSGDFASLRGDVARNESFQIYSSARGDEAAYLSLVNRAGLKLASLLEQRGDITGARAEYQRVLDARTDDATALTALARLSSADERERYFAAAFDANPFSMELIREYQKYFASGRGGTPPDEISVRRALVQMQRGEMRAAQTTLDSLLGKFPGNAALTTLRRETEIPSDAPAFLAGSASNVSPTPAELRQLFSLLQSDKLTADQRVALDRITFTSPVVFDAETASDVFESGTIGDIRFRFSEPVKFAAVFDPRSTLSYHVLGATDDGLLLEPVRLDR